MENSTTQLLQVEGITKSFSGLVAVKNLSFSISRGEIVGLIGPNGAGKTSAFNIIAGTYKPDSGSVILSGREISGMGPNRICRLGIARTFQIAKPFPRMTTFENVIVGAMFGKDRSITIAGARKPAMEAIEYVGLGDKADLRAGELTLAEQRRLELARAIASNPILLMLDEFMAGLNNMEIVQTLDLLKKLREDKKLTLLIIEHVMLAVTRLCEKVIVMNQGEKLAEGNVEEIVRDSRVIEAYMGKARAVPRTHVESADGNQVADGQKQRDR
jgi:branched-chain amino acid transport system ATP-binding protein